jgi:hypothetical protein
MPANDRRRRDDDDDYEDDRPRSRRRDDDDGDDRPRKRRREDDDDEDYEDDRPRRREAKSNGLATAGLILGILSLCTVGLSGIPAVICSLLALGKPGGRGAAIAGLVLGGLGTLGGIGLVVLAFTGGLDAVRYSAGRQKDANNMKQIGLAMFNSEAVTGRMSAPYAQDNFGKINRDLSWRVAMLPYIEQDNLYRQFDLSQAWNSPKNRPLSNTAIRTYTSPFSGEVASTQTPYRVFYGGGAMFDEDGKPVRLVDIKDGTSNTIMAAHAAEQVSWAEPRELRYDPNAPVPQLWAKDAKGTQVLMADGSVRFVPNTVSEQTLRAAITRAGGEMMGADW